MSRARAATLIGAVLLGSGCREEAPPVRAPVQPTGTSPTAPPPAYDGSTWGRFHSQRFQLTVPLPEGKAWKIDDHGGRDLVATHPPTSSRLQVFAEYQTELMNRAKCEERAGELGIVPTGRKLSTVERAVTIGPDAYDTGVWVALESKSKDAPLAGHLFLFSAFVRRCLFVHLVTEVPRAADEEILSARLAVARVRLLGGIKLDAPRTHDDGDVPREKPR